MDIGTVGIENNFRGMYNGVFGITEGWVGRQSREKNMCVDVDREREFGVIVAWERERLVGDVLSGEFRDDGWIVRIR